MANQIGWGEAHVNNSIGFGQGAENNTIYWGSYYGNSYSGETVISGISQDAVDFRDRVEADGGTVEAILCVSNGIK